MARMINWLPRVARRHREKGVAILLTLGVLSLTLVLVLSFAVTSTIDRRSAMNYADQVRARMLAESGLARAIGFLEEEMADDLNSYDTFYRATAPPWLGRAVTGSVNTDGSGGRAGIDDAFSVKFSGYNGAMTDFLPTLDATLEGSLGWLLIESVQDSSTDGSFSTQDTKVIGRLAYLIEDVSGYIDPNAWAVPLTAEGAEPSRTDSGNGSGFSVSDLNLINALAPPVMPALFLAEQLGEQLQSQWDVPGTVNQKWYSYKHILSILYATTFSNVVFANLRPFSVPETSRYWWNDANNNNKIDTAPLPSELRDKLDLTDADTSAVTIYNEMVGADFQDGGTYNEITKFSRWLQNLANLGAGYNDAAVLRHIAARTALNIQDYDDADNAPKGYYIDAATYELKPWNGSTPAAGTYESLVHGAEAGWHIGAALLELQFWRPPPGTTFLVRPHFNMEVFYADGSAPTPFKDTGYKVFVTYEYEITAGDNFATLTKSDTSQIQAASFTSTYSSSGGECAKSVEPVFMPSGIRVAPGAFSSSAQGSDDISVNYLRLKQVMIVKDDELVDVVPEFASGYSIVDFPELQTVTAAAAAAERSYAGVYFRAKDPLCMKLYDGHALASIFLETATPELESAAAGPPTSSIDDLYIGPLRDYNPPDGNPEPDPATWNQSDQEYGGVEFADGFNDSQVYEIGRVKGYLPGRSLRLWSQASSDAATHDGRLLDLFYAPNMPSIAGKVNINTQNDNVLFALFSDIAADANTAVTNAKTLRGSNGFQSVGQLGGVHDLINRAKTEDKSAETDYLPKIANLATVEQNFYNIIVTAQSIRDTTGILAPDSINLGPSPTVPSTVYSGEVLAEQQILATVYHNAFTNKFEILRYEYLYD